MQQCYKGRRSHDKARAGGDFWDVISTLTQDLTKARNQLARLMKEVKPGGASRLYGGDCGRPSPLQPIHRNFTPPATRAGSNLPANCHRTPPPGHFMCGKQYPHYRSPSPERRRPSVCRPASVFPHPFLRRQPSPRPRQNSPRFGCDKPRKRAPWSFDPPPAERPPYSCEKEAVHSSYERQEQSCDGESNCIKICINPRRRRRCRRSSDTCRDGDPSPARLQGGGTKRPDCLGTQFATLLEEVTCQLREHRLNSAVEEELSRRSVCS